MRYAKRLRTMGDDVRDIGSRHRNETVQSHSGAKANREPKQEAVIIFNAKDLVVDKMCHRRFRHLMMQPPTFSCMYILSHVSLDIIDCPM
jgi:hypothetical protein